MKKFDSNKYVSCNFYKEKRIFSKALCQTFPMYWTRTEFLHNPLEHTGKSKAVYAYIFLDVIRLQ